MNARYKIDVALKDPGLIPINPFSKAEPGLKGRYRRSKMQGAAGNQNLVRLVVASIQPHPTANDR